MIKKILTIIMFNIILILCFTTFKTFAASSTEIIPTLVISTGSNISLEVDEHQIAYSNVNFNKAGTYLVTYQHLTTKKEIIRTVKVIDNQDLINNGILDIEEQTILTAFNYKIIKTVEIPNGYATLCCDDEWFYLIIQKNNKINKQQIVKKEQCALVDILYDEQSNSIYGYGHYFNQRVIDIYLFSFSVSGRLKMTTVTGGSKQDEICAWTILDDVIVIGGKTRSSDDIFEHTPAAEDSYILIYDKYSGDFIEYINLGMEGIDYISKLVFLDDLYAVMHYYYQNVPMTKIVKINLTTKNKEEIHLTYFSQVESIDLKTDGENIYYLCKTNDNQTKVLTEYLYQITTDLKTSIIDQNIIDENKATSICVDFDNIIIVYKGLRNNSLKIINTDEEKIVFNNIKTTQIYVIDNIVYLKLDDYNMIRYKLEYLSFKNKNNLFALSYKKQFLQEDQNLSFNNYNPEIFGIYDVQSGYHFNNYLIIYHDIVEVKPNFNICDNNIYQKGIVLEFNAEGYLNGKKIENKTSINEIGIYYLELVGYNTKSKYYKIEIVDINNQIKTISEINILGQDYEKNDQKFIDINNNYTEDLTIKTDTSKELWYIIIPILLFISSLFGYFYLKEVKNV